MSILETNNLIYELKELDVKIKSNKIKLHSKLFKERSKVFYTALKGLNLFKNKTPSYLIPDKINITNQQLFLDPTWGSIWSIAAAKNHYYFSNVDELKQISRILFSIHLGGPLHITKFISLSPRDVGYFVGILYDTISTWSSQRYTLNKKISDNFRNNLFNNIKNKMITTNFKLRSCTFKNGQDEKQNVKDCYPIPKEVVQNKLKEYKNCIAKKRKDCSKKTKIEYYEFQNKNKMKFILDKFIDIYKIYGVGKEMLYGFHLLLTYLWCSAVTKKGLWDYYEGLREYEKIHQKQIFNMSKIRKENFVNEHFTLEHLMLGDELKKKNEILGYIQFIENGEFSIDSYNNNLKIHSETFPDCGATSLRNFFKIMLYDKKTNTFNVELLKRKRAANCLIEFFSIFDKDFYFTHHTKLKDIQKIKQLQLNHWNNSKDQEKDAFTAWSDVVQNLNNVIYEHNLSHENKNFNFEIVPGMSKDKKNPNILAVLKHLFPEMKHVSELKQMFAFLLDIKSENIDDYEFDNTTGFGKIQFEKRNREYYYHLSKLHFHIEVSIDIDNGDDGSAFQKLCQTYLNTDDDFSTMFHVINDDNLPNLIFSLHKIIHFMISKKNKIDKSQQINSSWLSKWKHKKKARNTHFVSKQPSIHDLYKPNIEDYKKTKYYFYLKLQRSLFDYIFKTDNVDHLRIIAQNAITKNRKYFSIIKYLIEHERTTSEYLEYCLSYTIQCCSEDGINRTNIIQLMLDNSVDYHFINIDSDENEEWNSPVYDTITYKGKPDLSYITKLFINKGFQFLNQEINGSFTIPPPLIYACEKKNINCLRVFLNHKDIIVNIVDKKNRTPLCVAVENNQLDIVHLLLDSGSDVSHNNYFSLMRAISLGHYQILKLILNKRLIDLNKTYFEDTENKTFPLMLAQNNTKIIKLLLDYKANVHVMDEFNRTPLFYTNFSKLSMNTLNNIKLLLDNKANINHQDNKGRNILMDFINAHHWGRNKKLEIDVTRFLINNKADVNLVNKKKETTLMKSVYNAPHLAEQLLKSNVKVNAKNDRGDNVLSYALPSYDPKSYLTNIRHSVNIMKTLLKYKADIHNKNKDGNTILMKTSFCSISPIVKLLLEHKASVNDRNKNGKTPLILCVAGETNFDNNSQNCNPVVIDIKDTIKLLIEHKADVNLMDTDKKSAIDYAWDLYKEQHIELPELLFEKDNTKIVTNREVFCCNEENCEICDGYGYINVDDNSEPEY